MQQIFHLFVSRAAPTTGVLTVQPQVPSSTTVEIGRCQHWQQLNF